jgi:parallel beta-helix repeat protein
VVVALGLIAGAALVVAGPLDPPSGPVAPTYKTLGEVEPRIAINPANTPGDIDARFKITAPGSYYLMGNVQSIGGKTAIEIASSGVTLDLCGFEVQGGATSEKGIRVSNGGHRGICVRNGTVRECNQLGVDATFAVSCEFKDLRLIRNFGGGLAASNNARVVDCLAEGNSGVGIEVFGDSTVRGCVASGGATGIKANYGTIIEGNTVNTNLHDGILVSTSNRIVGNICNGDGNGVGDGAGIHATGASNHIEGNTVVGNDRGIHVDAAGNFIARNTARNCATAYAVSGTQTMGPIITATGTITSTNPWANFTY